MRSSRGLPEVFLDVIQFFFPGQCPPLCGLLATTVTTLSVSACGRSPRRADPDRRRGGRVVGCQQLRPSRIANLTRVGSEALRFIRAYVCTNCVHHQLQCNQNRRNHEKLNLKSSDNSFSSVSQRILATKRFSRIARHLH